MLLRGASEWQDTKKISQGGLRGGKGGLGGSVAHDRTGELCNPAGPKKTPQNYAI